MPETPAISVEEQAGAVIVRVLAHDLDESNIARVRGGLAEAVGKESSLPFILDLSSVKFVPSLTLGALVRIVNEFRARRQRLIFVSLRQPVRQVLAITRLDRLMEIMDDVETAMKSVGVGH